MFQVAHHGLRNTPGGLFQSQVATPKSADEFFKPCNVAGFRKGAAAVGIRGGGSRVGGRMLAGR